MTLKLDLSYKKLPLDVQTPEQLTSFLLREIVGRRYQQNMPRMESRMWARIMDALDVDPAPRSIDVHEDAYAWLKECVNSVDLPPAWASWRWVLIDSLT